MKGRRALVALAAAGAVLLATGGPLGAQQPAPSPCPAAVAGALDFWIGDWTVAVGGRRAGTDRVERVSKGAGVLERWTDADGSEGTSLFSFDPYACTWHQLWITDTPGQVGGLKHKDLVAFVPGASVRFQGAYPGRRTVTVLDRTTLTVLADGTVRQLIEISVDGGTVWQGAFDAIYTRR
jgi:hypothetical protein